MEVRANLGQDMYLSTVIGQMLKDFIEKHIDPAVKDDWIVFGSYEDEARIYYSLKVNSDYKDYFVWKHTDKAIDVMRKVHDLGVLDDRKFNYLLLHLLQNSEVQRGMAEANLKFMEDTKNVG